MCKERVAKLSKQPEKKLFRLSARDMESGDYAAVIEWLNPDFKPDPA